MVRFIHTADIQLGMPFQWASGQAQGKLRSAREDAIGRVGNLAEEEDADFILMAGDLFDANTVENGIITRACERLRQVDMPVYVIPGNHDACGSPDCIYNRDKFRQEAPANVKVRTDSEPVALKDGEAVLLPAPVQWRHEIGDPTSHISEEFGREVSPEAIRIGLAHGGVRDFTEGQARDRITEDRAQIADLDYLALGDWHGQKEIGPRTWYSGTPEPTSFKEKKSGFALMVEIEGPGSDPTVASRSTAQYQWQRWSKELRDEGDVDRLEAEFSDLEHPLETLVRLELSGTLSMSQLSRLKEVLTRAEEKLVYLRRRGEVHPKASEEEIDEIATTGYPRKTVQELRAMTEQTGEEGAVAREALQLMYQLSKED